MINSVAVLGAGVMGAQIAAHFANAGVPALLLDVTAEAAELGPKRARGLKPDPFFTPDTHKLIATASLDEGLARLKDADWILEAIVEKLDVKRELMARVDAVRRPGSIVSSNTSAISIASIAEGRSDDFRRHFLGTHFFNPPRYLHLLEVIPTPETDRTVLDTVASFADRSLGKGVVVAKDSPGFIGNHLALYGVARIIASLEIGQYTIEEIDEITGPAIGRPKSATFRTLDLAGLDILGHVIRDLHQRLPNPDAHGRVRDAGLHRADAGEGTRGREGRSGFLQASQRRGRRVRDPHHRSIDARVRAQKSAAAAVARSRPASINDVGERIKTLFNGNDRVGQFLRETLAPTLVYAAQATPAIAYSADDVDRVMRWGFGWDLGPFEIADAIGIERVLEVAREVSPDTARTAAFPSSGSSARLPHVRSWRSCAARRIGRAS